MKWLEEAGVDFFDISGGTYESPAWRGNIMTELAERPSQKERGSYFIEWAQEMKKILVSDYGSQSSRLPRPFIGGTDCRKVESGDWDNWRMEGYSSDGRGSCQWRC